VFDADAMSVQTGSAQLLWWPAAALAAAVRERTVSSVEIVTAFLDRIDALNDTVNAIVARVPRERALAEAARADRQVARGEPLGPIHGLPIAVKDLMDVAGLPTTHGSVAYVDAPPAAADSLLAERLRRAGAIFVGKTNTPEFGLGTVTFNRLFGPTRNPWDVSKNAGGSSGGAAAAVAAGMLPFADGSDSGGSVRYPAAFCNLVGLRPTPGRIPSGRRGDGWSPHGVLGPIARSAEDAGLLLAALAGSDPRAPLALDDDPLQFADVRASSLRGMRLVWSATGGGLPIDPDVSAVLEKALTLLRETGAIIEVADPDLFEGADECWETIEMLGFVESVGDDVLLRPETYGEDLVRNVEQGSRLTATEILAALRQRTELFRRIEALLSSHDVVALPATPLVSVPVDDRWPEHVAGVRMHRYFEWQRLACRVTVTAHPALTVPAGFSDDGMPVGLQLIGRHRGDLELLRRAAAIDALTGFSERHPALPR
jgi:amidase